MRKFSIARLMAVIGLLGVFAAAIRNASELWSGIVLGATLLVLAVSLLGVVHRRGPERAWWLGFALLGWGYLVLVQGPWFSEKVGSVLPTSLALDDIHRRVVEQPARSFAVRQWYEAADRLLGRSDSGAETDRATTLGVNSTSEPPEAPSFWKVAIAGASDYYSFTRIGHCAFALLLGLVGAMISRRMGRTAKPTESPERKATTKTTTGGLDVHA
jgi:hypothetical protein